MQVSFGWAVDETRHGLAHHGGHCASGPDHLLRALPGQEPSVSRGYLLRVEGLEDIGGKAKDSPAKRYDMIRDLQERIRKSEYVLPLYADLPGMPEHERRAIFGLMVGQEGKTWPLAMNWICCPVI